MDNAIRRILMFLLGVALGYCTGFNDAQTHDSMVFMRVIERIQGFAERTVGDRQRQAEEAVEGTSEEQDF
jgi:hypothetical protein